MKNLFVTFALMIFAFTSPADEMVSAYFKTPLINKTSLTTKMKAAGLELIGEHKVNGSDKHKVYIFTHPKLKELGEKKNRAFAATLRVLNDHQNKKTIIANPSFFQTAFMQKESAKNITDALTAALNKAFPGSEKSKDALKSEDLAGYHFMFGMPYYDDFIEVGEGKDLYQKLIEKHKAKVVFDLEVGGGHLVGVKTESEFFVEKIDGGTDTSNLLPYPVFIKGEKAIILHPKFYLAISYPLLSMGQFMVISDIPGKIEAEFEKFFE